MKKKIVWRISLALTFLFYLFLLFLKAKLREMTFGDLVRPKVLSFALAGVLFTIIIAPLLKPAVEDLVDWINRHCFRGK